MPKKSSLYKIFHLRINEIIDFKMTERVIDALGKNRFSTPVLLAVSINSFGGSLVQAKSIFSHLKRFSETKKVPIHTFAEDFVFNSANVILSAGDRVFANKYSLLGDIGYSFKGFGVKKLFEDLNIQNTIMTGGKNKMKLNPFEELKAEEIEWIKNIMNEMEKELKSIIKEKRKDHIEKMGVPFDKINQAFQSGVIFSEDAKNLGFIDEISTFQKAILSSSFDKYGIQELGKTLF